MKRILVTGAGGPAAITLLDGRPIPGVRMHAADMDPHAAGLYMVTRVRRAVLPRGDAPDFVDAVLAICERDEIDLIIPTCDAELLPIARATHRFHAIGTKVLTAPQHALETCLDKARVAEACRGHLPVPDTRIWDADCSVEGLDFPVIVKPRAGSGSRGIQLIEDVDALERVARDGTQIVQAYLPGEEYSVDCLVSPDGEVLAAVPRLRLKVDSGVAVCSRTVHDERLSMAATAACRATGVTYVANVQLRLDAEGVPHLLEINPRLPGTLSLTIAAGIDMARWSVMTALGLEAPRIPSHFREVAVVRHLVQTFMLASELGAIGEPRPVATPMDWIQASA